jgi:hypothetical protein
MARKIDPFTFNTFIFVSSVFLILLFFMKSLPSFDNSPATYLYTKNCSNFSCSGCPNNQTGFVENFSLIPVPKVNNSTSINTSTIFKHLPLGLNNSDSLNNCQVLTFDRYRYGADILLVCCVLTLFIFAALISEKITQVFSIFFILLFIIFLIINPMSDITLGFISLSILVAIALILIFVLDYLTAKGLKRFLIASTNTQLVLIFLGIVIWILNKIQQPKELFVSLMPCISENGLWEILSNPLNFLLPAVYLFLFAIFLCCSDDYQYKESN